MSVPKRILEVDRRGRLFWPLEWLLLAVASVNLVWFLFDFSYLYLHDFYTLNAPQVIQWYDPMKGIERHRTTEKYLVTVDELKQVLAGGNATSPAAQVLLSSLRAQSKSIIDDSPFELVDKQGKLERIKNRIRRHMKSRSATGSFQAFWSAGNLTPSRAATEIKFFDQQLRPGFEMNYYRSYGEDGDFVNNYWRRVDLWFMAVFAGELVLRVAVTRIRYPRLGLQGAIVDNGFDLLNLIPAVNLIPGVHLGWLGLIRIFSYGDRLQRLGAFPSPVAVLINRYSALIADQVTDLVVVKVFDQMQEAVLQTDFTKILPAATRAAPNVANNPPTAIDGFVRDQTKIVVKEVLPQVRPELEQLLTYSVKKSVPLPAVMTSGLVTATLNAAYGAADGALKEDPEGTRLTRQLIDKLLSTLGQEWRMHGTAQDAKEIVIELLQQTKLDYIKRNEVEVQ